MLEVSILLCGNAFAVEFMGIHDDRTLSSKLLPGRSWKAKVLLVFYLARRRVE